MSEERTEETKTPASDLEWARVYAREKAWLMSQGVVSRAVIFHEPGTYVSPENQEPVEVGVLELEDGNAFLANEENFRKLTTLEVRFYQQVIEAANVLVGSCAKLGAQMGVPEEQGIAIIISIFQHLIRRLTS